MKETKIDFNKYKLQFPKKTKMPKLGNHSKYYKSRLRQIKRGLPKV